MFNPDLDFSDADRRDNRQADRLISDARAVYTAPGVAWETLEDARWHLIKAQTAAEGVGAVRYDLTKVQSSVHNTVPNRIASLLDYEAYYTDARNAYTAAVLTFRYCLQRAVDLGLFTPFQAQLWREYRERGHLDEDTSLQKLADKHNLTKRRVQYLVTDPKAIASFCRAVEDAMKDFAPTIAVS